MLSEEEGQQVRSENQGRVTKYFNDVSEKYGDAEKQLHSFVGNYGRQRVESNYVVLRTGVHNNCGLPLCCVLRFASSRGERI